VGATATKILPSLLSKLTEYQYRRCTGRCRLHSHSITLPSATQPERHDRWNERCCVSGAGVWLPSVLFSRPGIQPTCNARWFGRLRTVRSANYSWVERCEYLCDEGFCPVAQCSPLLEQVYIKNCIVTDATLIAVGQHCHSLRQLEIDVIGAIYDGSAAIVAGCPFL
jgi:hypothetical protein